MACLYLNSLGLYLDNELALNERRNLDIHIKNCPQCQEELRLLRLGGESMRANKIEIDSADFLANLKNKIIEDQKHNQQNEAIVNDLEKWSKKLIPLPLVLAFSCWLLLLTYVNNDNPVEEYLFGENLSDISSLIDQPGSDLG